MALILIKMMIFINVNRIFLCTLRIFEKKTEKRENSLMRKINVSVIIRKM